MSDKRLATHQQEVRVIQIVAGALMMGVLIYAGIVYVIAGGVNQEPSFMTFSAMGFALMMYVMHFIVPHVFAKQQIERSIKEAGDIREKLFAIHRTKTIVGLALLEGSAFLGLTSYLVEKSLWAFGVAVFQLFIMSIEFPGTSRIQNWIETQVEEIEQRKSMT